MVTRLCSGEIQEVVPARGPAAYTMVQNTVLWNGEQKARVTGHNGGWSRMPEDCGPPMDGAAAIVDNHSLTVGASDCRA